MGPGGPEIYMNVVQRQIDSKFGDLDKDLNHRFAELERRFAGIDGVITSIRIDIHELEAAPKATFRAYITPIIISLVTAIALAYLVRHGVAAG